MNFNFLTSLKLGLYVAYATLKLNTKWRVTLNLVLLPSSLSSSMLIPGLYRSEDLMRDLVHSRQALHHPSYNPAPYCLLCYEDQVFWSWLSVWVLTFNDIRHSIRINKCVKIGCVRNLPGHDSASSVLVSRALTNGRLC